MCVSINQLLYELNWILTEVVRNIFIETNSVSEEIYTGCIPCVKKKGTHSNSSRHMGPSSGFCKRYSERASGMQESISGRAVQ